MALIDPPSIKHDSQSSAYLIEESLRNWKRIKRGDLVGRNGRVIFPQLAGGEYRVIVATVYVLKKKTVGIVSISPCFFTFGPDGDLYAAFSGHVRHEVERIQGRDQKSPWVAGAADLELVRKNLFEGQKSTLLSPRYD